LFWADKACSAANELQSNMILSHGDLDQHNVIWSTNTTPAIIDWESVSLQNPTQELFNLCLDWSGFPDTLPCKNAFLACYEGYQRANGGRTESTPIETALTGEFAYLLYWLSFSLSRSIATRSDEELEIAVSEASNALRSLRMLDECKDLLLSWI
jgi:aminoglycoside phosphotransferase (APT) family kinase protein